MIDGHVHLERGPLSKEYVLEFVKEAVNKGITHLQILDHTHRFIQFKPIYEPMMFIEPQRQWLEACIKDDMREYLKLIDEMKKEDLPIEVTYGLEVCYQRSEEDILRDILSNYHFDFLVGSVHAIDHIAYDCKWSKEYLWDKYPTDEIYKKYYNEVFGLLESDLFTQIGHPDTIKMFNYYPSYDLKETYETLADLAIKHHVKVENNTKIRYKYKHADLGLNDELLKICKQRGCEMITSSDAHEPAETGTLIKDIWKKTMY